MREPGAREEESLSYLKAYTVGVTFTDAADAEQYARVLIEDGTKIRRHGASVVINDLVLPWAEVPPLNDKDAVTLDRFLDQYVEADVLRAFENDVRNGIRPDLPRPYWEIVDRRPLTRKEQNDLEKTRKALKSI